MMNTNDMPHVGRPAPEFTASSTNGVVSFPSDFAGMWSVLFFYTGDFRPEAASDILAMHNAAERMSAYETKLIAVAPDSVADHIAWMFSLRSLNGGNDISVELASDQNLSTAALYGVNSVSDDNRLIEKAVFIVDPMGVIQTMHSYPHSTGINFTEIERELLAIQSARHQHGMAPSGWTPGDDMLDNPPQTLRSASGNMAMRESLGSRCLDWYICFRPDTGIRKPTHTLPKQ